MAVERERPKKGRQLLGCFASSRFARKSSRFVVRPGCLARRATGLQSKQSGHKGIDVLARVVESDRGAHGALEAIAAVDWLSAVMSRSRRDALVVKRRPDV